MLKKIDHIAIAVNNLDSEVTKYRDLLGLKYIGEEIVATQMVRVAFFEIGNVHLELMEPTSAESPLAKFLEKRGEGFHHIAYQVDDLEEALKKMNQGKINLLNQSPQVGSRESLIGFIHPKSLSGVLVELVQKKGTN